MRGALFPSVTSDKSGVGLSSDPIAQVHVISQTRHRVYPDANVLGIDEQGGYAVFKDFADSRQIRSDNGFRRGHVRPLG